LSRVPAISRRLPLVAEPPCVALADVALDRACLDEPTADQSTSAPPDVAPALIAPNVPAQPSSIQPRPPSLLPPAPASATGRLRLEVEPTTAQVFVDGFYAGSAAEINERGMALSAGWHRLVFRAPGHETAGANVTVQPKQTTTYRLAWHPAP
jgi:hypothetical protein